MASFAPAQNESPPDRQLDVHQLDHGMDGRQSNNTRGGRQMVPSSDIPRQPSGVLTAGRRDVDEVELSELRFNEPIPAESASAERPSAASVPSPRAAEATLQDEEIGTHRQTRDPEPPVRPHAWLQSLYTISYLVLFSLLGTLARLGTNIITTYPGEPVTSAVLWSNFGGSLIMGFLTEDRALFGLPDHLRYKPRSYRGPGGSSAYSRTTSLDEDATIGKSHLKHKKTLPLYIGLTTGFCGCYTSFSSFLRDAFLNLTNEVDIPSTTQAFNIISDDIPRRNGAFSFEALLAILLLHPALSMAALVIGGQLALVLRDRRNPLRMRSGLPQNFIAQYVDPLVVLLSLGVWLACLVLAIDPPSNPRRRTSVRTRMLLPLVLSPPGCLLRYYLAKWFNKPASPNFPLGTFLANVLGSWILAMAYDLRHAGGIGATWTAHGLVGSGTICAVLAGIEQGFCGSLTTVSTWVVELNGLSRLAAWKYGATSVAVGLAGIFIIMGSMRWTVGFENPVC